MITSVVQRIEHVFEGRQAQPRYLIEVLQDIQQAEDYLSEEAMRAVSQRLAVPLIEVFRVASFYKAFSLQPRGKHVITVCTGTACHVRGSLRMLDEVSGQLGIGADETTDDQLFTVESVACLGACALGPVVVLDGVYHHHMTPGKLRKLIQSIRDTEQEAATHA
ncbi:MAG: NAD(P)H-dependent oxidoreductase subunit E [Planctomycetes bacterium]|nr:NAD(P)H-dependent oxidoreductase subunit E [Planctomycetota bacterium]